MVGTSSFPVYPQERVVIATTVNASISPMSEATSATVAEGFLPPRRSHSQRLPEEIRIVRVEAEGRDLRIVGADPSGFINLRVTREGDTSRGRWNGRGIEGTIEGSQQAYTGSRRR